MQPEDPNVLKTREQDFRKGRQASNSGALQSMEPRRLCRPQHSSHMLCVAILVPLSPRPSPSPRPIYSIRIGNPAGVYIYYTSAAVSEIRLPVDGKYLILCRGAMGVGRDQVHILHGAAILVLNISIAAQSYWSVVALMCPRACEFCVGSLRSTCRVRHQSGTATPAEAGPAWKQSLISRKTTCFVSSLVRLENLRAVVAGGRLWHIEKLKLQDGMSSCRDRRLAK